MNNEIMILSATNKSGTKKNFEVSPTQVSQGLESSENGDETQS